jgi:hypothetical protein
MFKWMVRHEIDVSVGCGGFLLNTDVKTDGASGYGQVKEVDIIV